MGGAVSFAENLWCDEALTMVQNPPVDPANVVQSLVYTLLDVFDATRDLYNTLRDKDRRDCERNSRYRGYRESRKFVDDDEHASDEGVVMDKAAVTRQFDIGLQDVGASFAVGDGPSRCLYSVFAILKG